MKCYFQLCYLLVRRILDVRVRRASDRLPISSKRFRKLVCILCKFPSTRKIWKHSNELINGRSIGFHYVRTIQRGTYHKTNWHMAQKYRLRFGCPQQYITSQIHGEWDHLEWWLMCNAITNAISFRIPKFPKIFPSNY